MFTGWSVACSMASAGFAACMGGEPCSFTMAIRRYLMSRPFPASPETVLQVCSYTGFTLRHNNHILF
jgi:hypothetical protein